MKVWFTYNGVLIDKHIYSYDLVLKISVLPENLLMLFLVDDIPPSLEANTDFYDVGYFVYSRIS